MNNEKAIKILLVDDERPVQRSLEKTFLRADMEVESVGDVTEGLALFKDALENDEPFDIAILDMHMPNFEGVQSPDAGLDLLKKLLEIQPDLPVVMLTAFDTVSKAKATISAGARDYFVKGREEGLVELARKIHRRKKRESHLDSSSAHAERQAKLLEAAAKVGQAVTSLLDLDVLFSQTVDIICDAYGFYYAGIFLIDPHQPDYAVLQVGRGEAGRIMVEQRHKLKIADTSMIGWCINHKQARIALDVGQDAVRFNNPYLPNTRSEMALPLIVGNKATGAVTVQSVEEAAFSKLDITSLQAMANQLAIAIQNATTHAQAQRHARLLETAAQVGRAVTSILNLDELLPRTVDLICDAFEFYYAGVFLIDETGKWAVLRAGSGEPGQIMLERGHRLEVADTSMIGWCINHKQARIALDVGEDAVRFDNPYTPKTRSEMALPLIVRGKAIGALTIQSEKKAAFSEMDIKSLQAMADQLAVAINNARLLNDLNEANRELLRTKTFQAIAQATGEAIHWVGNKAAPIPSCISRVREDTASLVYMADELLKQAPSELRQHLFAQLISNAAVTLDEKLASGRELIAGLENRPFKKVHRLLNMDSILEDMDIIKLSAVTILDIKENLIGPARESHKSKLDVNALLRKSVSAMAIPSHVHVEQRYASGPLHVDADPRQLENVFNNLLKNAVEAMEGRPEQHLTIETLPEKTDGFVTVRISDTGCGIPKSDLDRIWISFYTTKGDRGGTGLGLSSCLQIVNQMEGRIEVESEVDVGTTFSVLLPTPEE